MAVEIELKAHVEDCKSMYTLLGTLCEYAFAFEKEDTYWKNSRLPPHTPKVRLRTQTRRLPDESVVSSVVVTQKVKELKGGIEVNDEREFTVSSVTEFQAFLKALRFTPSSSKQKHGWTFFYEGITVELVEVVPLGWFVEIEILTEDDESRTEAVEEGRKRLLAFLQTLGVPESAIESRYYSDMLKEHLAL